MTIWKPKSEKLNRPIYLSIVKEIEGDIRSGKLKFGNQLPTHRDLAYDLGISVQTVSRAYEELANRNLIAGEVGRGSFVSATATDSSLPYVADGNGGEVIDLSILKPVIGPRHLVEIKTALRDLGESITGRMVGSFRPSNAHKMNCEIAASWLSCCRLEAHPKNILITDGATPALTVAMVSVARPGTVMLVEEITHHTILPLTRYLGINVVALSMDENGVLPESMDNACRANEVSAIYLGPNGENPYGSVMPEGRRREVINVARKHGIYIIENGAYGPLIDSGLAPLASRAPERTFYITSFTKCIMPALRTGYLLAPSAMMPSLTNRNLIMNWMANPISSEIASSWVTSGLAEKLMLWQRSALRERYKLAARILPKDSYVGQQGGLHLWLNIPSDWGEKELVSQARHRGVAIAPSEPFKADGLIGGAHARVSLGSTEISDLSDGLEIVAGLIKSKPEPSLLVIENQDSACVKLS